MLVDPGLETIRFVQLGEPGLWVLSCFARGGSNILQMSVRELLQAFDWLVYQCRDTSCRQSDHVTCPLLFSA